MDQPNKVREKIGQGWFNIDQKAKLCDRLKTLRPIGVGDGDSLWSTLCPPSDMHPLLSAPLYIPHTLLLFSRVTSAGKRKQRSLSGSTGLCMRFNHSRRNSVMSIAVTHSPAARTKKNIRHARALRKRVHSNEADHLTASATRYRTATRAKGAMGHRPASMDSTTDLVSPEVLEERHRRESSAAAQNRAPERETRRSSMPYEATNARKNTHNRTERGSTMSEHRQRCSRHLRPTCKHFVSRGAP